MKALKNFLWWLCGFVSAFVIAVGGVAIAAFAVPSGVYFGYNEDLLDAELQGKSLFTLLTGYQDIQMGQLPFVKKALQQAIDDNGLDKYFTVDWDKFDEIAFADLSNVGETLMNSVTVTATLDNVGAMKALGDLAKLNVMNEWTPLTTEEQESLDPAAEGFVPALYYYAVSESEYAKAFDKDGVLLPEAVGKTLYYPALRNVNILDLMTVFAPRLSQEKVRNLIGLFSEVEEGSLIDVILKDMTVGEIGGVTPDELMDDLYLKDFFPVEGNESLYDILLDATGNGGADPATLTIGMMNGNLDINAIRLNVILGSYESNQDLYDILISACGDPSVTADTINIGNLSHLDIDAIQLKAILGNYEDSKSVYDILISATGVSGYEELTVGSLSSLDPGNIALSAVMPKSSENEKLYSILSSATGVAEEDLTVNALNSFNPDQVKVVDVIDFKDGETYVNVDFYNIVKAVTGTSTDEEVQGVTIADIANMKTNDILLNAVLDPVANADIYDVLIAAVELQPGDPRTEVNADNLCIGDLQHFRIAKIPFNRFVSASGNETLVNILLEATGKANYDDLVVGDIQNESTFNIGAITLKNVMTEAEAGSLATVLSDLTGMPYNSITINSLKGLDITGLHLSSVLTPDATLESILIEATGAASYDEVTIDSLNHFSVDGIKLGTVMSGASDDLKTIVAEATGKAFADVTVSDLSSGFVIGNVKLSSVVNPTDAKLVSFLEQATGKAFADIILSDLDGGFNTDNVKLTAFLPVAGNEGLYSCLIDAMGVSSADEITIGSLNGGFHINDIKLKTVLPSSSSSIVQALIEQDTTIGNLGTAVDSLTLYNVYGENCFTSDASMSATGDKYKVNRDAEGNIVSYQFDNTLVDDPLVEDDVYYLSVNASVWALLAFNVTDKDLTNGRGNVYAVSTATIASLEGNAAGNALKNSTVYQLVAAGLIDDNSYSDALLRLTLSEVLDAAAVIA